MFSDLSLRETSEYMSREVVGHSLFGQPSSQSSDSDLGSSEKLFTYIFGRMPFYVAEHPTDDGISLHLSD